MMLRPGALPLLRNLANLMSVTVGRHLPQASAFSYFKPVVIWVFRRIKIPMIILYELIDFIKMIRIKMFPLNAELSSDRFGKELRFIGICLGDLIAVAQWWIVALTQALRLKKSLILGQGSLGSLSKLIVSQNFSQLACVSTLRSSLTCFCNWLIRVFTAGSLI